MNGLDDSWLNFEDNKINWEVEEQILSGLDGILPDIGPLLRHDGDFQDFPEDESSVYIGSYNFGDDDNVINGNHINPLLTPPSSTPSPPSGDNTSSSISSTDGEYRNATTTAENLSFEENCDEAREEVDAAKVQISVNNHVEFLDPDNPAQIKINIKNFKKGPQQRKKKQPVPENQRTEEYMDKRKKNTESAKKSRDLGKIKYNSLIELEKYWEEKVLLAKNECRRLLDEKDIRYVIIGESVEVLPPATDNTYTFS